jgi:AraC-like DNA-binding protein
MTDAISNLLDLMRVSGTAYIAKNLQAPWGILIDEHPHLARFHLIISGSTWIGSAGSDDLEQLNAGDIAIFPEGRAHVYSDDKAPATISSKAYPTESTVPRFEIFDKDSKDTHLLCGYFEISTDTPQTIRAQLPSMIIGRSGDDPTDKKFDIIVDLAREELLNPSSVSQITLNRLTEVLCVYTIQNWLDAAITTDKSIRALADPKTKIVLDAIHSAPTSQWTVENLAQLVGQSRTAFAAHFRLALGISPIRYVRQRRIKWAFKMLEQNDCSIDKVAFEAGYADTNAFNRAFKRQIGTSPGAVKNRSKGVR